MKSKIVIFSLLVCAAIKPLSSQTYSSADSLALLDINASCDASDSLNWDSDPDPGKWEGVTWNNENPKRVSELRIFDKSLTGSIDVTPLTGLEDLRCYNNNLTNLNVSLLSSLFYLRCYNNQLNSLELSGLPNLTFLDCSENPLFTINVSALVNLTTLSCSQNQLTELDVSGLTKLHKLFCGFNQLTDLDESTLSNLTALSCYYNQLKELDVSTLTNLTSLYCDHNQLTSLNVSALTNLNYLDCKYNYLASLDLSNLTNLISLSCENNKLPFTSLATGLQVDDYSYIPQDSLFAPYTIIEDVILDYSSEALVEGSMTSFVFYKNDVEVLSNSTGQFTTTGAGVYYCKMTNAKFPGLTLITSGVTYEGVFPAYSVADSLALLSIDANCDVSDSLNWNTEPDPGKWTGVTWNNNIPKRVAELNVNAKSLKNDMDVSGLTHLTSLECSYNQLSGLNVSGLSGLAYMTCYRNQLTSLDVSDLVNLHSLSCRDNQLTSLDILALTNLDYLLCHNNRLTSLDLSGLTELRYLDCANNQLTELDVSALSEMYSLECDRNRLPLSSLATGLFVGNFIFAPQDTIFEPQIYSGNIIIDYSAEALIDGTTTQFVFFKDGSAVESNTTGIYTTLGPGEYYCTMANALFPDLIITTARVTISPVTGSGNLPASGIDFYPNPVRDMLCIKFSKQDLPAITEIYSVNGTILLSLECQSSILEIDMEGLEPGTYILRILTSRSGFEEKIVKL